MAADGRPSRYSPADHERALPEQHSSRRSDFARDRARLLHSSALRRLGAKTQVLSPTLGLDFARNRLTHSLEVAQVGRELGESLGLDPDIVDTACLAHDLGHPPFGHNGERALNEWAAGIGGFEGNAQTLRLLTRLEPKVFSESGASYGLNLTRASLDASCKYPWAAGQSVSEPFERVKFGYYPDDADAFDWMRQGAPAGRLCMEAQVMDLSDDIAYSVHDFEDAVVAGFVDVRALSNQADRASLIESMHSWTGPDVARDQLTDAFDRLEALDDWLADWDDSRLAAARLKNLTSQLIGRFAKTATRATREAYPQASLIRYGADLVVPDHILAEIAVLKGIVATHIMSPSARKPVYAEQRRTLTSLADALADRGPEVLEPGFAEDWRRADDDDARRRVIVDQVANLTDQSALAWQERLVTRPVIHN